VATSCQPNKKAQSQNKSTENNHWPRWMGARKGGHLIGFMFYNKCCGNNGKNKPLKTGQKANLNGASFKIPRTTSDLAGNANKNGKKHADRPQKVTRLECPYIRK